MKNGLTLLVSIALITFLIAMPLIQIWGINTLFDLDIGYSLANYAGMLAVNTIFTSHASSARKIYN